MLIKKDKARSGYQTCPLGHAENLPELFINANVDSKIALFSWIAKESFP